MPNQKEIQKEGGNFVPQSTVYEKSPSGIGLTHSYLFLQQLPVTLHLHKLLWMELHLPALTTMLLAAPVHLAVLLVKVYLTMLL